MNKLNIEKRDVVLTIILLLVAGLFFVLSYFFFFGGNASYANVYYGTSNQAIVSVNFDSGRAERGYKQDVPSAYTKDYPVIEIGENEEGHAVIWVTLLGDYEIDDIRQELVVEFDLDNKSIEIIEEESPLNICSRQGISTGAPLICLPNRVRVEFVTSNDVDIDYLS